MNRLIYAAYTATAIAFSFPVVESYADTAAPSVEQQDHWRQDRAQRLQRQAEIFDARIVGFKASLGLTSDQEKNWAPFEAALRDLSKPREAGMRPDGVEGRADAPPSPIERMRAASARMGQRSTELSALANAATPLYTSLDDKQKVVFDDTLRGLLWRPHFGRGRPGPERFERRG
jgi:hypothetical protein